MGNFHQVSPEKPTGTPFPKNRILVTPISILVEAWGLIFLRKGQAADLPKNKDRYHRK